MIEIPYEFESINNRVHISGQSLSHTALDYLNSSFSNGSYYHDRYGNPNIESHGNAFIIYVDDQLKIPVRDNILDSAINLTKLLGATSLRISFSLSPSDLNHTYMVKK